MILNMQGEKRRVYRHRKEAQIILLFCLGIVILSIYVYRKTKKSYSTSMNVAEYANQIQKTLRIHRKANKIIWIATISLFLFSGTSMLIYGWSSNLTGGIIFFFICFFIALFLWVFYYIGNVAAPNDIELVLEFVLEDLKKGEDKDGTAEPSQPNDSATS